MATENKAIEIEPTPKDSRAGRGRRAKTADGSRQRGGARRSHATPEERRQQILLAAFSCFAEKGYHAATMDDLVRASGLSKGSLYWHFRSKEEVLLGVFDVFAIEIYGEWDAAAESGADALEVLRRACDITVETLCENRTGLLAWAEFLNHPAARERMGEIYQTARSKMAIIIERGRAEGTLRRGPAPEEVAGVLVGTIEGLLLQWLVDPDFALKRNVKSGWEVLTEGLRS